MNWTYTSTPIDYPQSDPELSTSCLGSTPQTFAALGLFEGIRVRNIGEKVTSQAQVRDWSPVFGK